MTDKGYSLEGVFRKKECLRHVLELPTRTRLGKVEGVFRKKECLRHLLELPTRTRLGKVEEGPFLRTADCLVLLCSCSWMWLWFKRLDVCFGEPVHLKVQFLTNRDDTMLPHLPHLHWGIANGWLGSSCTLMKTTQWPLHPWEGSSCNYLLFEAMNHAPWHRGLLFLRVISMKSWLLTFCYPSEERSFWLRAWARGWSRQEGSWGCWDHLIGPAAYPKEASVVGLDNRGIQLWGLESRWSGSIMTSAPSSEKCWWHISQL